MEGTTSVSTANVSTDDDFVVRQFSPARIERLLLTRLFELTTGSRVAGEFRESSNVASVGLPAVTAERKEAA